MKRTTMLYLDPYYEYLNFLKEPKHYDPAIVTHTHHIIPKCLGGSDVTSNLVELSVDDHCKAHLMLSACFDVGSYESLSNIRSANFLDKKSIRDADDLARFGEANKGENNPFYGKTHSRESIQQMLSAREKNGTTRRGTTYVDFYGSSADVERKKRAKGVALSWERLGEDAKNSRIAAIKESIANIDPARRSERARAAANAQKGYTLEIEGILFNSMKEAESYFGLTAYFIKKDLTVRKIKNENA